MTDSRETPATDERPTTGGAIPILRVLRFGADLRPGDPIGDWLDDVAVDADDHRCEQ
jgi:hypothetical protein